MNSDTADQERKRVADATLQAGQEWIRACWSLLSANARASLVGTGSHTPRESVAEVEVDALISADTAVRSIGELCTDTYGDSVKSTQLQLANSTAAVWVLLRRPGLRDEVILRFALEKIFSLQLKAQGELFQAEDSAGAVGRAIRNFFRTTVIFLMPFFAATVLVAAVQRELFLGAVAMYGVAYGIGNWRAAIRSPYGSMPPAKAAWTEWNNLRIDGHLNGTGRALCVRLDEMAARGVDIPPVIYDIAHILRAKAEG